MMNLTEKVLEGAIQSEGTFVLDGPTTRPAGRVPVIVQTLPELPEGDTFRDMMELIWIGQKARGHGPRRIEEVEAELRQSREDWEEWLQAIERLQEESRRIRDLQT